LLLLVCEVGDHDADDEREQERRACDDFDRKHG
jgi:hypothetical protein